MFAFGLVSKMVATWNLFYKEDQFITKGLAFRQSPTGGRSLEKWGRSMVGPSFTAYRRVHSVWRETGTCGSKFAVPRIGCFKNVTDCDTRIFSGVTRGHTVWSLTKSSCQGVHHNLANLHPLAIRCSDRKGFLLLPNNIFCENEFQQNGN